MLGIEYAMFEKGVVLDPVYNTADLMDARGDNAWPITTYTYAIIRTNIRGDRLRQGATCGTVRQLMLFWDWFLSSPHLEEVLAKYASVRIPRRCLWRRLVRGGCRCACSPSCASQMVEVKVPIRTGILAPASRPPPSCPL